MLTKTKRNTRSHFKRIDVVLGVQEVAKLADQRNKHVDR